ncbi:MAG: hypothetical protein M3Z20_20310, partial [Chloroflexota bacterium]|nr:hypothetical protein [Chloroflexota bacterium]
MADEAALASGKQRKVDAVSFVAMLDRVKANLRTLDFHGKRLALEALAERVVAGKDTATWRLGVGDPVRGWRVFRHSLPYFFVEGMTAVMASIILSMIGL